MTSPADINLALATICDHLSQRTAILFSGAGVNHGTRNAAGREFPLGGQLATAISADLLSLDDSSLTLEDAAEIARYQFGDKALNDYLYQLFEAFEPTNAHFAAIQVPWDVIYTTNFDLLIEKAATSPAGKPAGAIQPVFATTTDLTPFREEDILYYKLHGSIDFANSPEGRLILTKNDYRRYQTFRKPLFQRLKADLSAKTFVFVGYSFSDSNFRAVLDDCRSELGTDPFPLSYAIRQNHTAVEATFWREKYNIQLLDIDAFEFLNRLRDTWANEGRTIVPFQERQTIGYTQIDESTRFRKVGESFYRVVPADCTGKSNAKLFYRGGEPSWSDIRDSIAPRRDGYLVLMEGLFADFADPTSPFSSYLITGHAGTGKTTLIRTAAYEVARDYGLTVLVHVPGTPLDARLLSIVLDEQRQSRILVIIHHAGDYVREIDAFVDEVKRRKFPVSLILEERKNQWAARLSSSPAAARKLSLAEVDLGSLSTEEIGRILDSLQQWGSLGRLTGVAREFQEEHFNELADKELLVALRELTTEGSFDQIIRDEYEHIPTQTAKNAYIYVAALGQIHLALRYEVLARILGISSSLLGREVFRPADGVLITGEVTGSSRHNIGFRLSTRHPIIASIIFAFAAEDDESKYDIISDLITALDPGYPEDRRLLEGIVKRKDLVNTISNLARRREIYERLQRILPNSAFVLQHRSILERELRHAANAVDFARRAVALDRHNSAVLNTLGMALEFAARETGDLGQRRLLVREARKIFDDGIARHAGDPFSYIGKVNVIEHHDVPLEPDPSKKALLRAEVLSVLEDAYEQTGESPMLARALADQREKMGNPEHAIKILKEALLTKPGDSRIRDLLVTYEQDVGRTREALEIALGGIKFDPNSWRLQRHVARLMRVNGYSVDAIRSAYEAALRHKKGDIPLLVEFGAFLFTNGLIAAALNIFEEGRKLRATGGDKRQARHWWVDEQTRRRVFSGRVTRIQGGAGFVSAVPENFEAFFWRTENWIAELRETDRVQFQVAFNAMGPLAKILVKDI